MWAVKGGCNLRFFLGSPRSSEDLDLDVHTIAPETLAKNVEKTLDSVVKLKLKELGVNVLGVSAPKQTDTVQRWKIALEAEGETFHTKIEFSRRPAQYEPVRSRPREDGSLPEISHYPAEAAAAQKVQALAYRGVSQSRDVFDLWHLCQNGVDLGKLGLPKEDFDTAIVQLNLIGEAQYQDETVAYISKDTAEKLPSWDDLAMSVWNKLEKAKVPTQPGDGGNTPSPLPKPANLGSRVSKKSGTPRPEGPSSREDPKLP